MAPAAPAIRLHPILTGVVVGPAAQLRRLRGLRGFAAARGVAVPRGGWIDIPVPAFLLEHPQQGPFLVDSGIGTARTPAELYGKLAARSYRELRPERTLPELVRERGVDPAAIALVVMTHLHADHAAGLHLFPHAEVVVSAPEWEAARRGHQIHGYRRDHLPSQERVRTLPDEEVDLFGDGSVRLLPTPGHCAGHRSIVVQLAERPALLCGDAAYTLDTITDDVRPGIASDRVAFEASLALLRAFLHRHPGALLIPSHDMAAWEALEPVYA